MATYRPVYINIWKDPTFEDYKPPMKLIFIYLITNESTTESGIYPITIKTISNETGIPIKTVTQLLSNGLKNVVYDFGNSFVFVKNFLKYSSGGGRPDLLQKSIEKNYKNFNTPLWNEFMAIYPEYSGNIQTVDKPLINRCSDVASISISNSKDNSKDNKTVYAEFVLMTPEEHQKLIDKYGKGNTDKFIEKLDNSKGANRKLKYDSDYRAILNWVVDAVVGADKKKEIEKDYQLGVKKEKERIKEKKEEDNYNYKPIPSKIKEQIHKVLNITDRDKNIRKE